MRKRLPDRGYWRPDEATLRIARLLAGKNGRNKQLIRQFCKVFGRRLFQFRSDTGALARFDITQHIGSKLLRRGYYEPHSLALAADLLSNGGTFVDAGANVGLFCLYVAPLPSVRLVAIEPMPETMTTLLANARLNPHEIIAISAAVGEQSAVAAIGVPEPDHLSGAKVGHCDPSPLSLSIVVQPLETLLKEAGCSEVTVLKMDVEGLEMDALNGIDFDGPRRPENIILEHSIQVLSDRNSSRPAEDFRAIEAYLTDRGYDLFDVTGKPYSANQHELIEHNLWARPAAE